jgi:hypothetical protein
MELLGYILVKKPEVKRPLGRPRRSLGNIIKIGLKEVGREYVDLMQVVHCSDRVPSVSGCCLQ